MAMCDVCPSGRVFLCLIHQAVTAQLGADKAAASQTFQVGGSTLKRRCQGTGSSILMQGCMAVCVVRTLGRVVHCMLNPPGWGPTTQQPPIHSRCRFQR